MSDQAYVSGTVSLADYEAAFSRRSAADRVRTSFVGQFCDASAVVIFALTSTKSMESTFSLRATNALIPWTSVL